MKGRWRHIGSPLVSAVVAVLSLACGGGDGEAPNDTGEMPCRGDECGRPAWTALPGGTFQMGLYGAEGDELPVHVVTVPAFEIATMETTQRQYKACVDAGACSEPACPWLQHETRGGYPVTCVDWSRSKAFCDWSRARLCSEAEWEYAARSGGKDQSHPWGNQEATCDFAVMDGRTKPKIGYSGCGTNGMMAVCSKPAGNSDQGVCDLVGNVFEWVEDCYQDTYLDAPVDGSARSSCTTYDGTGRVSRGGAWYLPARYQRAAARNGSTIDPYSVHDGFGFRCCRSAAP